MTQEQIDQLIDVLERDRFSREDFVNNMLSLVQRAEDAAARMERASRRAETAAYTIERSR